MNNRRNKGGGGQDTSGRKRPFGRDGESSQGNASNRQRTTGSGQRGERSPYGERSQRNEGRFGTGLGASGRGRPRSPQSSDRFSNTVERGGPRGRAGTKGRDALKTKTIPNVKIVSDLQITDGNHKGKYLLESPSPRAKTMNRKLRELLFRVLFKKLPGHRFLDLSAGSGMIGIEAISRGALIASMVERGARLASLVKKNLDKCEIKEGHGELFHMEAVPFLKQMSKRRRRWDIVYFRPAYSEVYDDVVAYLRRGTPVEKGGTVIIGHHAEMEFPDEIGVLKRWRIITEGDDALSFYGRQS